MKKNIFLTKEEIKDKKIKKSLKDNFFLFFL